MELRLAWRIVRRWWWLILLPVLVVGLLTLRAYRPPATTYQTVIRFAVGTEPPAQLSVDYDRYYPWLTSEYVANALADAAVSDAFAERVSARLATEGLSIPASALRGAFVGDNAQSIAVLYITWSDPDQLEAIARAAEAVVAEEMSDYFPQMAGLGAVARPLDEPTPVPIRPSLKAQLVGPAIRLILAGALGLLLAFLAHAFDPFVRDAEEVEALGLPVLVRLPRR